MKPADPVLTTSNSAAPANLSAVAGLERSAVPGPGDAPVIFFDGVCGLCNHWIDFVVARDRRRQFRFAPLQGETARDWLQLAADDSLSSVILCDKSGVYRKSDAVWRMLMRLGRIWWLAGGLLWLIPRPVRNWGYDIVARRRYRWFGQKETCRLPTADERERFLP
jgi:predicted DCC family thiol-disulfide oxidoreductase YuxK